MTTKADVMKSYIPPFLRDAKAFSAIVNAEGPEMDQLRSNILDLLDQFHVETATWGLDWWETKLKLSSFSGKPYDQRRSRIYAKLRGIGKVDIALIRSVAESWVYGNVEVTKSADSLVFHVKFIDSRGIPSNLNDLQTAIYDILPSHMDVAFEFTYLNWDELDAAAITWNDLDDANFTWDELEVWNPGANPLVRSSLGLTGSEQ